MPPTPDQPRAANRYAAILVRVFQANYRKGDTSVPFTRDELESAAKDLEVKLPKNLGDLVYSFRYRDPLPTEITSKAPKDHHWVIRPDGRAKYRFDAVDYPIEILPNTQLAETKVPDATPGLIARYALSDEQALLAKLRYNRLVDLFTALTCYSLQSHLRTTAPGLGQIETDELYVGVDRRGAHYVLPVQAKGGNDRLSMVQIEQDVAMCRDKFPDALCRPVAAQFMRGGEVIALFAFEAPSGARVRLLEERHYRLVPHDNLTPDELRAYAARPQPST